MRRSRRRMRGKLRVAMRRSDTGWSRRRGGSALPATGRFSPHVMTTSPPECVTVEYRPGVFALRMLITLVGGWVFTTIAGALLMRDGFESQAIALRGLLNLGWYALIIREGYRWWVARNAQPAETGPAPAVRAVGAPSRNRWPVFGSVSVVAPILAWLLIHDAFYTPRNHGATGESALIGFFAVGFLCVVALVVGLISGLTSVFTKERRWVGLLGVAANAASAAGLAWLLSHA